MGVPDRVPQGIRESLNAVTQLEVDAAVVQQDEVDIRFRPAITTAERTDCRERQTLRFTNHALVRERTFPQLNESSLGERRPLGSRNSPGRGDGASEVAQVENREIVLRSRFRSRF